MAKPDGWNRSQTEKVVQQILGVHGRVWVRKGWVTVGLQRGEKKLTIAGGASFLEAIENAFIKPLKALEEAGGREALMRRLREEGAPPVEPPTED